MNNRQKSFYKKFFQLPYFPIIIGPIILFSTTIFTGKALFWGTPALQFVPWWDFAWKTLISGRLPLWNPLVGMGAPLVANYQTALFYPPYWIHLGFYTIGGTQWMAWSITIIVILHLIWAGIGTAKLMEDLGINKLGQTVAGMAFSLSGYLVSRAGFLSINAAVSWLPWIMLFSSQLVRNRNKALISTGITVGMMLLAGHAQTAWYAIFLAGIWTVFLAIKTSQKTSILNTTAKTAGRFFLAGLLGFGISAIQLIPTFEYLVNSSRSAEYGYAEAMTYSFWPWRFFTIFVPGLFGSPARGNYWGYGNYWEDALYIGVMPVALALGLILDYIFVRKKKLNGKNDNRALVIFLTVIIMVGFIFALGKNTPVFPFLYRYVPTFNLFQAPTRFSIWVVFSLALLAGIGIDQMVPPGGKRLYWNRLAVAGCVAALGASFLAWFYLRDIKTTFIISIGIASLFGLGTSVLFLKQPDQQELKKYQVWEILVVAFIGLDLLIAGWGLNPSLEMDFYNVRKNDDIGGRIIISAADEYDLKFGKLFRFNTFVPGIEWEKLFDHYLPNTNMLSNIELTNNFDPIIPARYRTWMDAINDNERFEKNGELSHQVFDLMAVGGVSIPRPDGVPQINRSPDPPKEQIDIFTCVEYIGDENEVLDLIISEEVKTSKTLLLEQEESINISDCSEKNTGEFRVEKEVPGYLKLVADLPEDGWVFWSQSWYPGWRIKIDGINSGGSLKADYLFQAAEVPAGKHLVEFLYSPASFKVGAVITALTVILILTCWFTKNYRA